jgi:hypothetical protein
MGKMRVTNRHDWEDVCFVVAITDGKSCTAEPFLEGDFDLRIQKIGAQLRDFRRTDMLGNWKTNTGCSTVEELEPTDTYRLWAKKSAKSVDVLHEHGTGREYIMEVNGTSSGLRPDRAKEDNTHIRDLTLAKMNVELCPDPLEGKPSGTVGFEAPRLAPSV